MEKSDKKRILTRVLIVIAALTLLSCCFLGSTFARYVTKASGSGTVSIAKWDVAVTPYAGGNISFNKLSPDDAQANTGTNSTGWVQVAAINNSGDVDALVEISCSKLTVSDATFATGATSDARYAQYVSDDELNKVFSISYASDAQGTALTPSFTLDVGQSKNIYAKVTWTTQSDAQDTFFGEYLQSIQYHLSYTATQNSELPDPPAAP